MNRSTKILDLPDEILIFILNFLDITDLIAYRSISKRFKFLIDNLRIKKLIILGPVSYKSVETEINLKNTIKIWYSKDRSTDDYVYYNYQAKLDLRGMKTLFFKSFFVHLKELYFLVDFKYDSKLKLSFLNNFYNLEKLYFHNLVSYEFVLELNKLIDLSILSHTTDYNGTSLISINSKIERLEISTDENSFKFKYPQYLKYSNLLSINYHSCNRNSIDIKQFINLKTLRINSSNIGEKGLLEDLMKLNIEEIFIDIKVNKEKYTEYDNNRLIYYLNQLKNKIGIKRIFLNNVKLIRTFEHYEFLKYKSNLEFNLNNYSLFDNRNNLKFIDYNELIDIINEDNNIFSFIEKDKEIPILPIDFFIKFSHLTRIHAKNLDDTNQFIKFLNKLECLNFLKITEFNLNQNLIDELSTRHHSLYYLSLCNLNNEKNDNQLNFEPFLKLDHLSYFRISIELSKSIDFVFRLIKKLKYLNNFNFIYLGNDTIIKIYRTKHCIYFDKNFFEKLNLPYSDFIYNSYIHFCDRWYNRVHESLRKHHDRKIFDFHLPLYSSLSLDYMNTNHSKFDYLYGLIYFNKNISKVGLNYNQLKEYFQIVPNLISSQLEIGNNCDYNEWIKTKYYEDIEKYNF